MKNIIFSAIRIIVGTLLILTIFPPISIGVCNIFTLMPVALGFIMIFFPIIKRFFKLTAGKYYNKAWKTVAALTIVSGILFTIETIFIIANCIPAQTPDGTVAIVLGAKVNGHTPTIALYARIEAAADYLNMHPNSVCIASGGQGPDENISEAECIKSYLINNFNIPSDRIYVEDKSFSTSENIDNSKEIIEKKGWSNNAVIVTDGYHEFRATMLASRRGVNTYSFPANTDKRLFLTYYIRELFAIPKSFIVNK